MARTSPDRHFARFQKRGRPEDLAAVFDATAAELLRVASHLTRDLHEAEDLVQSTYLSAIERRAQYKGRGEVLAWLLGILVNKARNLNRRETRHPDPERLQPGTVPDPADTVAAGELSKAVSDAIAQLSEPYRPVLNFHLRHGLSSREIALSLGRPPATIRSQLARGLEMLRAALPPGLGMRSITAVASIRGLPAVRRTVLEQAGTMAATGAGVTTLGGVFLMKKSIVAGLIVAALAVVAWSQTSSSPSRQLPADGVGASGPRLSAEVVSPNPRKDEGAAQSLIQADVRTEGESPTSGAGKEFLASTPGSEHRVAVAGSSALLGLSSQEGGALEGTVLTAAGEPIRAARVELRQRNSQSFNALDLEYGNEARLVNSTKTDENGHFEFRASRHRPFQIHAAAAGFSREVLVDCYADEHYSITLHPGTVLEGQITTRVDHSPVGGVRVKAIRPWAFEFDTVTDDRGLYRIEDLPPGKLKIEILPPRHVSSSFGLIVEPGQVLRRDIQLESGGVVRGSVTDAATGQPVLGAEIGEGWRFQRFVRTDANGHYELKGFPPPGIFDVAVRARGYGKQIREVDSSAGDEWVIDFQLLRAGSASGRVVDSQGVPLRGVYVAGVASESDESGQQQTDWQSARTDDAGRFLIKNLRPDLPHALLVQHPTYGTLVYEFPERPEPEEVVEFGDVILHPGGTVLGHVVDTGGKAVPGVYIYFTGTNEDRFRYAENPAPAAASYVDRRETRSDDNGDFRMTDLSPGHYTLSILFNRRHEDAAEVVIQEWGEVIDNLRLVANSGDSISGMVITADGQPARDMIVTARPEGEGRVGTRAFRDNEFEIGGLQAGTYTLEAVSRFDSDENPWVDGRLRGVTTGSNDVVIVVARRSYIWGVVYDRQGRPAPGISVRARVAESYRPRWRAPGLTDTNGRFRLVVGEGEIVNITAGPPTETPRGRSTPLPDENLSVMIPDVPAGTKNLIIRLH